MEQDVSANKYVKYTVDRLEKVLGVLFVPCPKRSGIFQIGHSNGKISSAMIGLYPSASTLKINPVEAPRDWL
jgi:exocyst complex protein 7